MHSKFATAEATLALKNSFTTVADGIGQSAEGNFRETQSLHLSSIGIGTYLGNWDEETDRHYTESIEEYVRLGGNVIDTASNYRFQRSERNIGTALKNHAIERAGLFICSKGGYLPFDNEPPSDVQAYFEKNFVEPGIATLSDLVGGSHCMTPRYLQSQIDQSLGNMGIEGLDLFYIHNPESQLAELDRYTFEARIAKAFEGLEEHRASGKLNFYGIATWNGFRTAPDDEGYHSLERFSSIAKQVGGDNNGFKFIQLPYNLAMPEAYLVPNQAVNGKAKPTIEAAADLGISVVASASLLQGKLAMNVPLHIRDTLGSLTTDAMTSLQFVRSTPGVTAALVGMSSKNHVAENMRLAAIEPASESVYAELFLKEKNA